MISTARARANRRNAQLSTGPRTPAGKKRVAANALKHGLAVPLSFDPKLQKEIEGRARELAGEFATPERLDAACRIVEAQLDLQRVRQARVLLVDNPFASVRKLNLREYKSVLRRLDPEVWFREEKLKVAIASLGDTTHPDELPLEERMEVLAKKLRRLDRYESRALSRRKFAVREFDACAPQAQQIDREPS